VEVLVLDDHRLVAQAIAGVLEEVAGLTVQGICCTTAEACAAIQQRPPRLLVLDVMLGGDDYRQAVELLRDVNPQAELLFITAMADGFKPPTDLAPITIGVVSKTQAWDELLQVLRQWWQRRPDHLSESLPGCEEQLQAIDRLSPREQRLVLELGSGQLNKQIAARLQLSQTTVETYRKSVAAKLGISGAELVRLAVLYRCLRCQDEDSPAAD
jgi:DNA-binding NarL/FixJ family response regulator